MVEGTTTLLRLRLAADDWLSGHTATVTHTPAHPSMDHHQTTRLHYHHSNRLETPVVLGNCLLGSCPQLDNLCLCLGSARLSEGLARASTLLIAHSQRKSRDDTTTATSGMRGASHSSISCSTPAKLDLEWTDLHAPHLLFYPSDLILYGAAAGVKPC